MNLTLDEEERDILYRLVEAHRLGLSHEIHRTDTRAFKEQLRAEEEILNRVLAKLHGFAAGRGPAEGRHEPTAGPRPAGA